MPVKRRQNLRPGCLRPNIVALFLIASRGMIMSHLMKCREYSPSPFERSNK